MSIGYWSIDYWMFSCILPVYQVVKDEPDEEDNCGLSGQMAPPVMNEDPLSEFRWRAHEGSCFVRCLFLYQGETIRCSAVNAWLSTRDCIDCWCTSSVFMFACWAMGCPTTNDSSPRRVLPHRDWRCGAWQQQQVDCMIVCMYVWLYVCMYVCMIWQLLCPVFVLFSRRNNSMFGCQCLAVHVRPMLGCSCSPVHVLLSMMLSCWAMGCPSVLYPFLYFHTIILIYIIWYTIYWYTVYLFDLFDCPFDLFYVLYVCALQLSAVQN